MRTGLLVAAVLLLAPLSAPAKPSVIITVAGPNGSLVAGGSFVLSRAGSRIVSGLVQRGRVECEEGVLIPGDYVFTYSSDAGDVLAARPLLISSRELVDMAIRIGEQDVFEGRVVTNDMPAGTPTAQVTVHPTSGPDVRLVSGPEGRVMLDGLLFAGARVQARLPYHKPSEWVEIKPPYAVRADLRCPPETLVIGRVISIYDQPVTGAWIEARGPHTSRGFPADAQGRFELTDMQPGSWYIVAGAPCFWAAAASIDMKEGQQMLGLTIALRPAATTEIIGHVFEPDGKTPASGALVGFHGSPPVCAPGQVPTGGVTMGALSVPYYTTTGKDGSYRLTLPFTATGGPGVDTWTSVHVGMRGYLNRDYLVGVSHTDRVPIDFQLSRGARLTGTATYADGSPPPARTIAMLSTCATHAGVPTTAEARYGFQCDVSPRTGRFDFGHVVPGDHTLEILLPDGRKSSIPVAVREGIAKDVTVSLPAP